MIINCEISKQLFYKSNWTNFHACRSNNYNSKLYTTVRIIIIPHQNMLYFLIFTFIALKSLKNVSSLLRSFGLNLNLR